MSQLPTRAVCVLALVGFLVSALAVPAARAEDRDCAHFANQQEAQDYFIERGGPSSDPDLLDGDDDGVACDSLPCPCSSGPSPQLRPVLRAQTIRARVTEVTDGDTIRVKSLEATGPARYTVRLIGIDTPEVYGGIECGGRQASAHMKRIAPAGRRVLLRTDPTQATFDRYDRLLAYVKLRGGPDAAISQLRAGRAMVYVYGGNPFQRVRSFRRTQRSAREAVRGAWDTCDGDFHRGRGQQSRASDRLAGR